MPLSLYARPSAEGRYLRRKAGESHVEQQRAGRSCARSWTLRLALESLSPRALDGYYRAMEQPNAPAGAMLIAALIDEAHRGAAS
jgi:hypothetical protein